MQIYEEPDSDDGLSVDVNTDEEVVCILFLLYTAFFCVCDRLTVLIRMIQIKFRQFSFVMIYTWTSLLKGYVSYTASVKLMFIMYAYSSI